MGAGNHVGRLLKKLYLPFILFIAEIEGGRPSKMTNCLQGPELTAGAYLDDKAKVQSETSPLTGGSKENSSKTSSQVKKARRKRKKSTKKKQGKGGIFSRLVGYNGQKKQLGNFKDCCKMFFPLIYANISKYLPIITVMIVSCDKFI